MTENEIKECRRCINTTQNPLVAINEEGYCKVCSLYMHHFSPLQQVKDLGVLYSLVFGNTEKYNVLVGISGGKDSTVALYNAVNLGFRPLAFTFDAGYYPSHIFSRSVEIAKQFGVDHEIISIQRYMRENDRACYRMTAELYDQEDSEELRQRFIDLYQEAGLHYSVTCEHQLPFVRSCQLCRKTVIRGYYEEAIRHGVSVVILGINEWCNLSATISGNQFIFSGIRTLKPYSNKPPVHIVHLPFLLQQSLAEKKKILKKIGWVMPAGEDLVESNANSCLFGLAAEAKATRMLGFHPDTTRLSREVTAGFLSKEEAKHALQKVHNSSLSVREVLSQAGII